MQRMRELRSLRVDWNTLEQDELRLLRSMTIRESLDTWHALQMAFEAQLQDSAPYFEQQRRAALVELQLRLNKLADWQRHHDRVVPDDPNSPESA